MSRWIPRPAAGTPLSRVVGAALFAGVVLALVSVTGLGAAGALSPQQADLFARKVSQIAAPVAGQARRTPLSETEINSWFAYRAQPVLPPGVTNPQVSLVGDGRVSGQLDVNLDTIGRRRSTGRLDPWNLLTGTVPVRVTGTLEARNGVGRFALESAELAGIPVPKLVIQELLATYSRSAGNPTGVSLDDPFPLPSRIRQIEVGAGQAVVVQ